MVFCPHWLLLLTESINRQYNMLILFILFCWLNFYLFIFYGSVTNRICLPVDGRFPKIISPVFSAADWCGSRSSEWRSIWLYGRDECVRFDERFAPTLQSNWAGPFPSWSISRSKSDRGQPIAAAQSPVWLIEARGRCTLYRSEI